LWARDNLAGSGLAFPGDLFYFAMSPAQQAFGRPMPSGANTEGEASDSGSGFISKDTQNVGEALYRQAALPFEIASLLLLVALVGAVLLARGSKQEKLYE
jgi:hypothetical protein